MAIGKSTGSLQILHRKVAALTDIDLCEAVDLVLYWGVRGHPGVTGFAFVLTVLHQIVYSFKMGVTFSLLADESRHIVTLLARNLCR